MKKTSLNVFDKVIIHGLRQEYFLSQYSDDQKFLIITREEIANSLFRLDAVENIRQEVWQLSDRTCTDHFLDMQLMLVGYFINPDGSEYCFTDALYEERRDFWRHTIKTALPRSSPFRLREENQDFILEILSIYRATNPAKAALWGVRPANDE